MVTKLPLQLPADQLQSKWAALINPTITNPLNNASVLKSVVLTTGANVINHKLGRPLQGWYVVRMRNAAVSIYDTQDSNQTPALTLNLVSSGAATIDLAVF